MYFRSLFFHALCYIILNYSSMKELQLPISCFQSPIAVRIMNDQLMLLERAFIDPLGLPGRRFYR